MSAKVRITRKMIGQAVAFQGRTEILHGVLYQLRRGIATIVYQVGNQVYTAYIEQAQVWQWNFRK